MQASQAAVVRARSLWLPSLGGQHHRIASILYRSAYDLFGLACVVDIRSINEIMACVQEPADHPDGFPLAAAGVRPKAKHHRPETRPGNLQSRPAHRHVRDQRPLSHSALRTLLEVANRCAGLLGIELLAVLMGSERLHDPLGEEERPAAPARL